MSPGQERSRPRQPYHRLTLRYPAASEELLSAELWSLGTLGLEIRPAGGDRWLADAFFASPPGPAAERRLRARCESLGAELVSSEGLAAADWLAEHRRRALPFEVGSRLLVDPGDPSPRPAPAPGRRWLLRIPARTAFGTGSHASTRLAVELLEKIELAGRRVLDLGTGTGILAFAARLFGAASVLALELDPAAALIAGQNVRLNRIEVAVAAGSLSSLARGRRFDLAVANILPDSLRPELPGLRSRLRPGAKAIFSGLLRSQTAAFGRLLEAEGFRLRGRATEGDWAALRTGVEGA